MKRTYTIIEFPHSGIPVMHTMHRQPEVDDWLRLREVHEHSDAASGQCVYFSEVNSSFVMVFDRRPRTLSFAPTLWKRQEAKVGDE